MNIQCKIKKSNVPLEKKMEWILVIISSSLLGIWAVKNTIALRNVLLVAGTLLSIYYIFKVWKIEKFEERCTIWSVLPIIFVASIFIWVIGHYLFFSIDQVGQLKELKSTWLRAFMAFILGLATGLALRNNPNRLSLLWVGIFVDFLIIFFQYSQQSWLQETFIKPTYDNYIFHLKINVVLMGSLLIAGITGGLLDQLRTTHFHWRKISHWYLLYCAFGMLNILWTYIFIFDTRNGMAVLTILYIFWLVIILIFLVRNEWRKPNLKKMLPHLLVLGITLYLFLHFAYLQTTINKGWQNIKEDAEIAIQVHRYPNWQNLDELGYPNRSDGTKVTHNTYERIAWATVGSNFIIKYPLGAGMLSRPISLLTQGNLKFATHSGWVELGLAFGVPMLGLIFTALGITLINAARKSYPARMSVMGLIVFIFCFYLIGEATIQHGLEILFFLLALLPALLLTNLKNIKHTW